MAEDLRAVAHRCDRAVEAARAELITAVRAAYAAGMTQAAIAAEIGRSQPEVNRLLRFHGTGERARVLRDRSGEVRTLLRDNGIRRVRVFGSVARGTDGPDSDIDLLVTTDAPTSLLQLSSLEQRLAEMLGATVDLVPEQSLRPDLRDEVLGEAIPL